MDIQAMHLQQKKEVREDPVLKICGRAKKESKRRTAIQAMHLQKRKHGKTPYSRYVGAQKKKVSEEWIFRISTCNKKGSTERPVPRTYTPRKKVGSTFLRQPLRYLGAKNHLCKSRIFPCHFTHSLYF